MNSAQESSLIGVDGRPLFGIYRSPLTSLNLDDFRPHGGKSRDSWTKRWIIKYRIKRWEYIGIGNDDLIFGLAVIHLGYICNLFAYLFNRGNGRISEYDILVPGGGAATFEGNSLTGQIIFENRKSTVRVVSDPQTVTAEGSIKGGLSFHLSFYKYREPLVCLTRVGMKGFNYTHKEAGIPVRGMIRQKDISWDIQEDRSSGVRDYTLGYLARQTFWNWASGGGVDRQGHRIGFNLVQGVNETGFTENGFWIDGRLIKTDVVDFRYDDLDLLKSWNIESNDGRVRLRFLPAGKRSANKNMGLLVSKFHQPFGRFEGTLRDGNQVWELQNVSGFAEEHFARW